MRKHFLVVYSITHPKFTVLFAKSPYYNQKIYKKHKTNVD